jgi:hypothetical protein
MNEVMWNFVSQLKLYALDEIKKFICITALFFKSWLKLNKFILLPRKATVHGSIERFHLVESISYYLIINAFTLLVELKYLQCTRI